MNKRINVRNLIIAMLCFTVICLGIGFGILSMKLDNKTNEEKKFNVAFTSVSAETPVKGGKQTPSGTNSITTMGTTLKMNLIMYNPYDELTYNITIKNKGTLPAEILNIVESPDYINDATALQKIAPVTITHNDVIGKVLEPEEETTLRIVAIYNRTTQVATKNIDYQLSIISATPEK